MAALKIVHIVGARPNYMKVAPVFREMGRQSSSFDQTLIHTGQHFDEGMSRVFFSELELPAPQFDLGIGPGSPALQTAKVIERLEPVLRDLAPDWVIVPGDVTSTLAAALTASKLGIKVAHLEAGLRSFDRSMPEEVNRILTDQLADLHLTTEAAANLNLRNEGFPAEKIVFVGNVMIDSLSCLLQRAEARWLELNGVLSDTPFVLVTLHRPTNVDSASGLRSVVRALEAIANEVPVVFPMHPRTRHSLAAHDLVFSRAVTVLPPLSYIDFLAYEAHAKVVITDSGGVQEETSFLGTSCFTLRTATERPVTVSKGSNTLVPPGEPERLIAAVKEAVFADPQAAKRKVDIELWDGAAAGRVVSALLDRS